MKYLESLNKQQKEAVLHIAGPLLVLAGAGSGKTRVITHRIVHLIESGVAPSKVLAVTFTNKAAREMRERTLALCRDSMALQAATKDEKPLVTTFHSFGLYMLREKHALLNLRRHFTIFDRSDSVRAIKAALERAGYSVKSFEPRKILSIISRAKGDALSRDEFTLAARSYPERAASDVWQHYERLLADAHALDFDDLLLRALTLLRDHDDIRDEYKEKFNYLHIDEYQDTNKVQYEIMRLIAGEDANICAVGDIDQNIYSWRGADIGNILKFERHFPKARVIFLEENYRSTQTIVAASNSIIEKNSNRLPKKVFTGNAQGERISIYRAYNETDEAEHIASTAKELIEGGSAPSSIAVLFRANFQSRALEDAFLSLAIPYQVLGVRFFERREVKDALSFLRYALNPEGTADLSRIINVPPRGIGKITLLKLLEGRRDELTGATSEKVRVFEGLMDRIRAYMGTHKVSQSLKYIVKESGFEREFSKGGEEGLERLENLRELVSLATRYDELEPLEGAEQLISDAALASDQDELKEDADAVRLMTVHAAKGLEFPYVFITGLEEGLFPHERLSDERTDEEEERRLFYVALTRAEKKVFLSFAHIRTIYGSQRINIPSSFLSDIRDEHLESANPSESGYERIIDLD